MMTLPGLEYNFAIPELFMVGMIAILLLVDGLFADAQLMVYGLVQGTMLGTAGISAIQYLSLTEERLLFAGHYSYDRLSVGFKLVLACLASLVVAYRSNSIPKSTANTYYLCMVFAVLAGAIICSAASFLSFYLGLELLALVLYTMIALSGASNISLEAALKYFVIGSIASGLLLYAISFIYGVTGDIGLIIMHGDLLQGGIANMVVVLLLAGLLIKCAAVPFHMWLPDVYQGSANHIALFVATVPKVAVMFALLKVVPGLGVVMGSVVSLMLLLVAILSMILGNIMALQQTNLKRMFAYSAIAHTGYTLLVMSIGGQTIHAYNAAALYFVAYVVVLIGVLGILTMLSDAGYELEKITDLQGLNSRHPWLAFMMLIFMFAMAGIPPTLGFFAKVGLLMAMINAHHVWLALVTLFAALIGAYYYLRLVLLMYFAEPASTDNAQLNDCNAFAPIAQFAVTVNGLAVLCLGIWPSALIKFFRTLC